MPLTCNYHLCPQWPLFSTSYSLPLKQGSLCHTGVCLLGRSIPGAHIDELQLTQRDPLKSSLYFTSSQLVLWFDWRLTLTQWLEESGSAQFRESCFRVLHVLEGLSDVRERTAYSFSAAHSALTNTVLKSQYSQQSLCMCFKSNKSDRRNLRWLVLLVRVDG